MIFNKRKLNYRVRVYFFNFQWLLQSLSKLNYDLEKHTRAKCAKRVTAIKMEHLLKSLCFLRSYWQCYCKFNICWFMKMNFIENEIILAFRIFFSEVLISKMGVKMNSRIKTKGYEADRQMSFSQSRFYSRLSWRVHSDSVGVNLLSTYYKT